MASARSFQNSTVGCALKRPDGIAERRQVTLTVTAEDRSSSLADLSGCISAADAEEMRSIVEREFDRVDLREWQERRSRHERGDFGRAEPSPASKAQSPEPKA